MFVIGHHLPADLTSDDVCAPDPVYDLAATDASFEESCQIREAAMKAHAEVSIRDRIEDSVRATVILIIVTDFTSTDFAGDLEDSKSTSGGTLCIFGSHTVVPISWMCNIVMWETLPNNVDWDCFKIQTLREIRRIQNPLLEEHCAFLEVIRLFQSVGCVRNKHWFRTVQQNQKSFPWMQV